MVERLNTIAIARNIVVEGVSKRRTIEVSEMVGWDREKNDFKLQELFRWDGKEDLYKKTGESHLLKEISSHGVYSMSEINQELEKRKVILDYMVRKNIRTYDEVSSIVMDYFSNPKAVYRKARVS